MMGNDCAPPEGAGRSVQFFRCGRKAVRGRAAILVLVELCVPFLEALGLRGEEVVGGVEDLDGFDLVALRDGVHDVLAFGDTAEDVCLPSSHGVGTWVTKNWLPLVPGPRWPWRRCRVCRV